MMSVTPEVLTKYDTRVPRYTSYPSAARFAEGFPVDEWEDRLAVAAHAEDEALSLYVHLPFCHEACLYCGCHMVATGREDVKERYLAAVDLELERVGSRLGHRPLAECHWGGGTPTSHPPEALERLHRGIADRFSVGPDTERAVEVDPRVTTPDQLRTLRRLGFNRISIGIQDFDPGVQAAIGRFQTAGQTHRTYERCRRLLFRSVNFDLVCGLPEQTLDGFRRTLRSIIALRPDRVALYAYAHLPALRPRQRRIDAESLPSPADKSSMERMAFETLCAAGYVAVGMDHFALPHDDLARAARDGTLHRNFMGYTVRAGTDLIGIGVSAIGEVRGCFGQNERKLGRYLETVEAGRSPIERGYVLTRDDSIRRRVILDLMCRFRVDPAAIEQRFDIRFDEYFAAELAALAARGGPVEDGLIERNADGIHVTPAGRPLVRNLCAFFDAHLRFLESSRLARSV